MPGNAGACVCRVVVAPRGRRRGGAGRRGGCRRRRRARPVVPADPGRPPGERAEQPARGQPVEPLQLLDHGEGERAVLAGAGREEAAAVHLVLEPLDRVVPVAEPVGPGAREGRRAGVRAGVRPGSGRPAAGVDVADAAGAGVGVLAQAEDAGAGPRLPAALAIEDQGARVLLGGGGLVRVAGPADAAPGRQVELVGAVVAVAGVDRVVVARLAHPQPVPGVRGGVGAGARAVQREGHGGDACGAEAEHEAAATQPGGARPAVAAPLGPLDGTSTSREVDIDEGARAARSCTRAVLARPVGEERGGRGGAPSATLPTPSQNATHTTPFTALPVTTQVPTVTHDPQIDKTRRCHLQSSRRGCVLIPAAARPRCAAESGAARSTARRCAACRRRAR